MNYVLDAGPMIAFLDDEPGAGVVEQVLTEPESTCYAHIFNLMEIYYIYFRRRGEGVAEDALQSLLDTGLTMRDDHDTAFWKEAATFKGKHAIALPDTFCLTLARRLNGTVITTDHTEFDPLIPFGYCPILFIR
ncbi:MAG: type II toxin-antitoxin system VapC family toxin [Deltaproteobacteria bacterium]|nr:type II toxin-antitoxin system VapC family toxin [Deltaproteobacteria bacterium]